MQQVDDTAQAGHDFSKAASVSRYGHNKEGHYMYATKCMK